MDKKKELKDWLIIVSGLYETYTEFVTCMVNVFKKLDYNIDFKYIPVDETIINGENKNIIFIKGRRNKLKVDFINCKYKMFYQLEQMDKNEYFSQIMSDVDCTIHLFKNYYNLDDNSKKKVLCPIGYDKSFESPSPIITKKITKNLDVFHFGTASRYRKKWLKKNNIPVFKKMYGDIRNNLILNSKINLILSSVPNYNFPQLHAALILANQKFIVCNEMIEYYPFIENTHFVVIKNHSDLEYWLKNDEERINFGVNAYNEFKKIKMIDNVENMLNGI